MSSGEQYTLPDGASVPLEAIDQCCEVMHDAYEAAAAESGWATQDASRKAWADVPEPNKVAMRAGVAALLAHVFPRRYVIGAAPSEDSRDYL